MAPNILRDCVIDIRRDTGGRIVQRIRPAILHETFRGELRLGRLIVQIPRYAISTAKWERDLLYAL